MVLGLRAREPDVINVEKLRIQLGPLTSEWHRPEATNLTATENGGLMHGELGCVLNEVTFSALP